MAELLSAFSAGPSMLAFAEHFCAAPSSDPEGRAFSTFCSTILHECMTSEKPAIVRTYLELYTSVHRVADAVVKGGGVDGLDCLTVANLKVSLKTVFVALSVALSALQRVDSFFEAS